VPLIIRRVSSRSPPRRPWTCATTTTAMQRIPPWSATIPCAIL